MKDEDILGVVNEIRAQRQKEHTEGKNFFSAHPLHVVFDVVVSCADGDSGYEISTTLNSKDGYRDYYVWVKKDDTEVSFDFEDEKDFREYLADEENKSTEEDFDVLRAGYHDVFKTCCFTYEAAEEYIRLERHNLIKPYIYVECMPRRNEQMMKLAEIFGDKM